MEAEPFSFPVWVYVNSKNHPQDGYPYYLMTRGGHDSPIPEFMPVFSSREKAGTISPGPPFVMVEMDRETLLEALDGCRYVEDLVFDMGTPDAVVYRVEELLNRLGPNSAS